MEATGLETNDGQIDWSQNGTEIDWSKNDAEIDWSKRRKDADAGSDCGSCGGESSVSALRDWLNDFGDQNRKRYESNAAKKPSTAAAPRSRYARRSLGGVSSIPALRLNWEKNFCWDLQNLWAKGTLEPESNPLRVSWLKPLTFLPSRLSATGQ